MSNTKTEIILCFIDGEPTLYNTYTKKYIKVKVNYDEILELLMLKIEKLDKRPQMRVVWGLFSDLLPCCLKYNEYHNKKNKIDYNSFESRLTRDLTNYIDTLFKRGLTPEEKDIKDKEKIWLRELYNSSNHAKKRAIFLEKQKKRGRNRY